MCFQLKKMEELEKKKLPDDILNQITTPTTVTVSDEKSMSVIDEDIEAMLNSDYDGEIFIYILCYFLRLMFGFFGRYLILKLSICV